MRMLDTHATLSGPIDIAVKTEAAEDHTLASAQRDQEADRRGWQRVIDDYLVEWGRNPDQLEDEDLAAPSSKSLQFACNLAMDMRDQGLPAPLRVVPDGEGGVSFERRDGAWFQSLDVLEDGSIELVTFKDYRVVSRESIG